MQILFGQFYFNLQIGLLFCNVFPKPVRLRVSPNNLTSFICVRMVTRGLYPRLVRRNVKKHLDVLRTVGVENFIVEVVTVRIFIEYFYLHILKYEGKTNQRLTNMRHLCILFRITL